MANMNNKHCKLFKNDINQSQSDDNDDSQVIDNQSSKVSTELSQEWRKVLYDKQGVPDNFVPKSFLKDLKKNVNLRRYTFLETVMGTTVLSQQINCIGLWLQIFVHFNTSAQTDSALLFALVTMVTLFLYLATILWSQRNSVFGELKTSITFLVSGFSMSPVLRTLTETISTDTIYAMVTMMVFVHLIFHNYGIAAAIVSKPISLNAAIFASVCLASRLATTFHALAFLIFAMDIFLLLSILYRQLSILHRVVMTASFTVLVMVLMAFTFHPRYSFLYLLLLLFINFVCPYGFYRMQAYKENIYGPWDEAIIVGSRDHHPHHQQGQHFAFQTIEDNNSDEETKED